MDEIIRKVRLRLSTFQQRKWRMFLVLLLFTIYYVGLRDDGSTSEVEVEVFSLPKVEMCQDPEIDNDHQPPPPLVVIVAGGGRTGTTYLYNLARIILRNRDPNTISGWYEDLIESTTLYVSPDPPQKVTRLASNSVPLSRWNGTLDHYLQTGTTILVKCHSLAIARRLFSGCMNDDSEDGDSAEFMRRDCPVDLVVLSHRDLTTQTASTRRMGWGRRIDEDNIRPGMCRGPDKKKEPPKPSPRLTDADWADPKTWELAARVESLCADEWENAAGSKAIEVGMEGILTRDDRIKSAIGIATAINSIHAKGGIPNYKDDVQRAVSECDLLRPLSCSSAMAVNPLTHYHRGHISPWTNPEDEEGLKRQKQWQRDAAMGAKAIWEQPDLARWMKKRGYVYQ